MEFFWTMDPIYWHC